MMMKTRLGILIMLVLLCTNAYAYDVVVDGIYYNLNESTAEVTYKEYTVIRPSNPNMPATYKYSSPYENEITIPETIKVEDKDYSVTGIGRCAFQDCSKLTKVNIPYTVTSIKTNAFWNCALLKKLTVPENVDNIEKSISNKVDTLVLCPKFTDYSFLKNCFGLQHYSGVIHAYSSEIPAIKKLDIVEKLFPLDLYPDFEIRSVESFLNKIKVSIDRKCDKELKVYDSTGKVTLPDTNGDYWFTDLTPSTTYQFIFEVSGKKKKLSFSTKKSQVVFTNGDVDIPYIYLQGFRYSGSMINTDGEKSSEIGMRVLCKKSLKIDDNGYLYISETPNVKYYPAEADGSLFVKGLTPDTEYEILPYAVYDGVRILNDSTVWTFKITTPKPDGTYSSLQSSYTRATISGVQVSADESGTYISRGIAVNRKDGIQYTQSDDAGTVKISALLPGSKTAFELVAIYDDNTASYVKVTDKGKIIDTDPIHLEIFTRDLTPTTALLMGSYIKAEELNITKEIISLTSPVTQTAEGSALQLTGLKPDTKYTAEFKIYSEDFGDYSPLESTTVSFKTPEISFVTLPAKAISNTCAIIAAETNLSDIETNCGFEWRRYDAPDLVPSTYSPTIIVNGTLAGKLEGLSSNTYYKYRPYYKSSDGEYVYGDWLAFGTADAYVYFEPIVYTLESGITGTDVTLRGFAVAGSEEIESKGFEYWITSGTRANEPIIVEAEGMDMKVVLSGLPSNKEYCYRAFVKTAKGTTYGTTLNFTSPLSSGIDNINQDNSTLSFDIRMNGTLQIAATGADDGDIHFSLYSLSGNLIEQHVLRADGEWHSISSRLASGIYLIVVSNAHESHVKKYIIK